MPAPAVVEDCEPVIVPAWDAALDPLCDPDHDLKTYEGWALVEGKGKRPMVPPDDPRHPRFTQRPPP